MKSNNKKDFNYSIEYLKSRLDYNPKTGIFTWKYKDGDSQGDKIFNTKFGGKEAGNKNSYDYLQIKIYNKNILTHRVAYLFMTGEWPQDEIDHINGNRLDNRWENLRVVSKEENRKNQKINNRNTSGATGVSWSKEENKWIVKISVNKKQITLGYFNNFNEAVKVRKKAEVEYGYHENHGRKEIK